MIAEMCKCPAISIRDRKAVVTGERTSGQESIVYAYMYRMVADEAALTTGALACATDSVRVAGRAPNNAHLIITTPGLLPQHFQLTCDI